VDRKILIPRFQSFAQVGQSPPYYKIMDLIIL
jgi:hypothetical protein